MDYTEEELEALLRAFQIMKNHAVNDRQSIGSIADEFKNIYVEKKMLELTGER